MRVISRHSRETGNPREAMRPAILDSRLRGNDDGMAATYLGISGHEL